VWSNDTTCRAKAPTCQSFVQNNPSAFAEAYWSINSLQVYQSSSGALLVPTLITPAASSAIPVPLSSASGWSASQNLLSKPTPALANAEALVGTSQTAISPAAQTTGVVASPSAATGTALQAGDFGLEKAKTKKWERNQRHARHLLERQQRKARL
jgi:hypothetical protein